MPDGSVVQVAVRFGGDLLEVRYLDPGYHEVAGSWLTIANDFRVCAAGDVLRRLPLSLCRGHVTVELTCTERPCAQVPRRRFERRPIAFGLPSLAVHLGIWLLAIRYGATDEPALPSIATELTGRHARIARFAASAQTVKRTETLPPREAPITVDRTPAPDPATNSVSAGARERHSLEETSIDRGQRMAEPPSSEAGRTRRFDPTVSPDFDTIKNGAFATVATGRDAGGRYGSDMKRTGLVMISCDASSCVVTGGDRAAPIRKAVEQHLAEITACYEHADRAAGHELEIDFATDGRGNIDGLQIGGVGDVDGCVAKIINDARFVDDEA